jgi:hypothetical protein
MGACGGKPNQPKVSVRATRRPMVCSRYLRPRLSNSLKTRLLQQPARPANNRATFFPRALSIRLKPLRRSSRGGEEEFLSFRLKSFRDAFFSWNALTIARADLPDTDLTLTQTRQSKSALFFKREKERGEEL